MLSNSRNGNLTSSEIYNLLSTTSRPMTESELKSHLIAFPKSKKKNIESWPGKAAITYINQCNMERRLGRSLDAELDAKPTNWGKFVEPLLFSMLEDYTYNSSETLTHPIYNFWKGTPDGEKIGEAKTIAEAKCPYTLESFCKLVNPLYQEYEGIDAINALRNGYVDKNGLLQPPHADAEKYYWQKVSNACIKGYDYADFIIYCPYESELEVIKSVAVQSGNPSAYFIANDTKNSLPYIKDGGFYNNINIYSFRIPDEDKELLTDIVKKAGEYLIKI
jgi:hypothetical protein